MISRTDYEKDAWQDMLDNDAAHQKSSSTEVNRKTELMDFQLPEDIRLEAGKTYLFVGSFYDSGVFGVD